jgi:dTDP-4-dehydrorhamnose 3,5-epimerase
MNILPTELDGVLIIEPNVFGDERGFFMESFQKQRYREAGVEADFVQDNISRSVRNTLRGLHYQHPNAQAKLVQVLEGEIYDVAVDIRQGSPTFGRWVGAILSAENRRQFFLPAGFAHGFCVLSATALFFYKCSDFYAPEAEGGICWDDPDLGIHWPVQAPILSERDSRFSPLRDVVPHRLPVFGGSRESADYRS